MEKQKYYLGLDIGTDSVGYSVADMSYNVIKKGKKNLMGTRLFESGNTAEERRGFRSNRRRLDRKKERIELLQNIFEKEICKVDSEFFLRLKESMYHLEDKSVYQKNTLFNDMDYIDKNYHNTYKTIYHLRKALMKGEVDDIRLLYLGIEHILKYRGHFLFQGSDFGEISSFDNVYNSMNQILERDYDYLKLDIQNVDELEVILRDRMCAMRGKEARIYQLMEGKPTNHQKEFVKLLVGGKITLTKLFDKNDLDEDLIGKGLTFKSKFEEEYTEIESKLDEKIIVIEVAKAIYDWSVLIDILNAPQEENESISLSDAKIYSYELHRKELKTLKEMVQKYIPNEYKEIFTDENQKSNYATYIGMTKKNKKKVPLKEKTCSIEDFNKYVLNKFKGIEFEQEEYIQIVEKLKLNQLLPKQRVKENGVIPYQVHMSELKKILDVNKEKFSFLVSKQDGYSVEAKILSIFTYRIPYYVGPLNPHSEYAWVERIEGCSNDKIYPWNFEEVVNLEKSAEEFIIRMTNKCTYLKDKDVIPKNSILYSKFMVLNELNNLKVDGEKLPVNIKQELYHNLFECEKKVTQAKIKKYLQKIAYADKDMVLTGIDGDFKSSLDAYITFKNILQEEYDEQMVENVIKWIVLFSDDKKLLKSKIECEYSSLSKNHIKSIMKVKYSGWGKLSKEFLTTIFAPDHETGEAINIIRALYQTNLNLMQLLSKEYGYKQALDDRIPKKEMEVITNQDVKDLYCSPAVKKSIWQAVQIVQEIEKIMRGTPEKLFVEVTRGEGEKKRTNSRKKSLMESYKIIKNEYADLYNQLDGMSDSNLRQKKMFLYFQQLGTCAYTGKKIPLEDLNNHNLYDIEHIYPQSITKDDSIHNNLVLVYRTANADKSDVYPIPQQYRQEMNWKLWYEKELISKTKFDRLMRIKPFEAKELEGFIARQLVETSQSSKAVAELFEEYYSERPSKVVYVKAGNVSQFRHHFKIVKVRDLNDEHHAHDAYLNIVVGNVWDTKFTEKFFQNITVEKYNLKPEKLYRYNITQGQEFAWVADGDRSIGIVKQAIEHTKILFTRQAYENTGKFYDETIYKKGHGEMAVKNPLSCEEQARKLMDLNKYGGYKSIKGAYFCVVEHTLKKKRVRTVEYIPVYLASQIRNNESMLEQYLNDVLQLEDVRVILRKLKIGALLKVDGMPMHLSGRTNDKITYRGAVQLHMNGEMTIYFKRLTKYVEKSKESLNAKIYEIDKITIEENIGCYKFFMDKLNSSIYKIFFSAQKVTLEEKQEIFETLSLEEQVKVLVNLLTIFRCNPALCDLTLLGGGKGVGSLSFSKKISNRNSVKLINQSITGFYENEIDLLK